MRCNTASNQNNSDKESFMADVILTSIENKICKQCNIEKPKSLFYKHKGFKSGLNQKCIECIKIETKKRYAGKQEYFKAYSKAYYQSNKEDKKNKERIRYLSNSEKIKASAKEWALNNKDRNRENKKIWDKANPEKRKELRKNFREKNKGYINNYCAIRRAIKFNATPSWANQTLIKKIYEVAHELTKEKGINFHVDHIVPLKNKFVCGLHVADNLQILESSINQSKGNRFEITI